MKHARIKLAVLPTLPIIAAVAHHYFPAWISGETWLVSGLLGIVALLFSFLPWEKM